MADLGPLATKISNKGNPTIHYIVIATHRISMYGFVGYTSPGWAGHTGHPVTIASTTWRMRQTPAWWGTLPAGQSPVLPDYELRGRVMVRDPETLEDSPVPNCRVALFFRRTNYVVDMDVSDDDGYVHFPNIMPGSQAYYAIAFDPEGSPMQNSIIWDRLTSVPVS